jgi:hypothetical protein
MDFECPKTRHNLQMFKFQLKNTKVTNVMLETELKVHVDYFKGLTKEKGAAY